MTLTLSLFPGIGLLDSAFELVGYCVVRGPDVIWGGDVRRFHPPAGKFDGVIGGPPCQSFSSLAHLVRANGHEPKFGNLIQEFERCVAETECDWFLMEEVPAAPEPVVAGYGVKSFLLDNSALAGEGGFGLEQRRVRRFSFGLRGREAPNLLRWIDLATFLLPDATHTVSQCTPDNSQEAKGRCGHGTATHDSLENTTAWSKRRRRAVLRDPHAVPVAIGGSGKRKPGARRTGIAAVGHGEPPSVRDARKRQVAVTSSDGGERPGERKKRLASVTSNVGGNQKPQEGKAAGGTGRYRFADALRLQGLPEDFLADAPFTAEGKLKAVANGVPLPMGRAIARAILEVLKTKEAGSTTPPASGG